MYPYKAGQKYVRNAWYMAAWAEEVGREPLQRTFLDDPVVLYRKQDGTPVAMWGLCPHRHYPLKNGALVGDSIQCSYHGYTLNCEGQCTKIPAQGNTPKTFRQRTYPVVERGGLIWIWMGDADKAELSLLPALDRAGIDLPGWRLVPNGITPIKARGQLIIDNVMDLSHIGYLHGKTISAPDAAEAPPNQVREEPIAVYRWLLDQAPAMPYIREGFPGFEGTMDIELGSEFLGPGLVITFFHFYTSASKGDRALLGISNHLHGVTPETATTSHDFSGICRNFHTESAQFDAWLKKAVEDTREEDVFALEQIEPLLERYANVKTELSGVCDVGATWVRRKIGAMLDAEGSGS